MLTPEFPDRQLVKFPKIPHKSKSLPGGNPKVVTSSLDQVTAKSWLFCTPTFQYGMKY